MRSWTLNEIRTKIEKDLDLEGEDFIQSEELIGYINEAIDEAEADIHTTYEDYFLTRAYLPVVSGTNSYDLPENIYAQKIRNIMFRDQADIYEIKRLRPEDMFYQIELDEQYAGSNSAYRYYLMNDSAAGGVKLKFSPPMLDTGTQLVRISYLRNANRLELDADICDIPEFISFVIAFAKHRCLVKEDPQRAAYWETQTEKQRRTMIDTLAGRVPDADNAIRPDMGHYEDMS